MKSTTEDPDFALLHRDAHAKAGRRPRARPLYRSGRALWSALFLIALAWSLIHAGSGTRALVNSEGWSFVGNFFTAAFRPALNAEFLRITWDAALTTLAYAVLGTFLSIVIGLVGGVLASQSWWRSERRGRRRWMWGWLSLRGALSLPRGVHEIVWGLFFINILGLNPLVGVLAIGVPFGAVVAKVFSELLDEAPRAPFRALRAAGVGRVKSFIYGLGPQALPDMLSYGFYRFECSVRAAAILGIIGAGGLGYQLDLSFKTLRYGEMWTLIYALVILSGLADLWSTVLRRRSVGSNTRSSSSLPDGSMRRDRFVAWSLALWVLLVVASAAHLRIDLTTLWAHRVWELFTDIARSTWPIDLGASEAARLARLGLETLGMSIVAAAIATSLGMGIAFFAATTFTRADEKGGTFANKVARVAQRAGQISARAVLLFCRAIPPPVWALLFLFVLLPGPLPGAVALGLYNFGILGRLMAEVVEDLDPRPERALGAMGVRPAHSFVYSVLPRTVPRFATLALYRWEVTIRETVVVGLVGAGGLGRLLQDQLSSFDYSAVAATLLTLIALTFVVDLISAAMRKSLSP